MDLKFYLSLFLRRLPWLIVLAAIGTVLGVTAALTLPPTYRADATLIVESEQIPDDLAESTVRTGEIEALQIIQQRILSRSVLLELSNRLGIYDNVEGASAFSADYKVEDLRERINIRTRGGGPRQAEATIVTVSFSAERPQLTARVVNEIVTLILQENVRMRTSVATQTLDFFTQEVERLEQQLSEVSGRILNFQENNLQALPDSLDFRRTQQAALQERLLQLERENNSLSERRRQLVTLFESTGETEFTRQRRAAERQQMSPQETRLANLRDEYAQLAGVLSETNPRLAALRNRITAIENTIPAPSEEDEQVDTQVSLFDIQLADIDTQIEYIEQEISAIEERMADLSTTIEATPGNAVTLGSLEREYANLQAQYNQAVSNQARAETGNIIESLSKGQRITVIEQAVQPNSPSSPNRPLVAAAGFGGGLGLGIGLILLLEILNASIRRPQDLQNALGIDTLAMIPYIQTRREIVMRRLRLASLALVLLIGLPAGLWYVDRNVTPLQPKFEDMVSRVQDAL